MSKLIRTTKMTAVVTSVNDNNYDVTMDVGNAYQAHESLSNFREIGYMPKVGDKFVLTSTLETLDDEKKKDL